jgi:hypothetical protein
MCILAVRRVCLPSSVDYEVPNRTETRRQVHCQHLNQNVIDRNAQIVGVPVPLPASAVWDIWVRICTPIRRLGIGRTREGSTYYGHSFEGRRGEKCGRVLRIADELCVVVCDDWGGNEVGPMRGSHPQHTSSSGHRIQSLPSREVDKCRSGSFHQRVEHMRPGILK